MLFRAYVAFDSAAPNFGRTPERGALYGEGVKEIASLLPLSLEARRVAAYIYHEYVIVLIQHSGRAVEELHVLPVVGLSGPP